MLRKLKPQSLPLYKRIWRESQTKALAYIQLGSSGVIASIGQINKAVSDPGIKDYLDKIDLPTSIVIALAGLGIITFLAHGHGDD